MITKEQSSSWSCMQPEFAREEGDKMTLIKFGLVPPEQLWAPNPKTIASASVIVGKGFNHRDHPLKVTGEPKHSTTKPQ